MEENVLYFFDGHRDALPLYEKLEEQIRKEIPGTQIRVQKSQISFYDGHLYGCVSFMRLRKKALCPDVYLVVTFGLDCRLNSQRIEAAAEPYPGRWTHHMMITKTEEIDDELIGWMKKAAEFSRQKTRGRRRGAE